MAQSQTPTTGNDAEMSDEPYCGYCKGGPFDGETGLKIHTTQQHGANIDAKPAGGYCCAGEVRYTPHGRPWCADCRRILPEDHPDVLAAEPATDAEVREAIESFEEYEAPEVRTDGGQTVPPSDPTDEQAEEPIDRTDTASPDVEEWGVVTYRSELGNWLLELADETGTEIVFTGFSISESHLMLSYDNSIMVRFDRESMSESTPSIFGDAEIERDTPHTVAKRSEPEPCRHCGGTGKQSGEGPGLTDTVACIACDGTGWPQ